MLLIDCGLSYYPYGRMTFKECILINLMVDKVPALTIAETTFKHILNMYNEEHLIEREIFAIALENKKIEFSKHPR